MLNPIPPTDHKMRRKMCPCIVQCTLCRKENVLKITLYLYEEEKYHNFLSNLSARNAVIGCYPIGMYFLQVGINYKLMILQKESALPVQIVSVVLGILYRIECLRSLSHVR